jgi:hypothetical protein
MVPVSLARGARKPADLYWNRPLDPVDWKHAEQAFWALVS